jgi:hypothetical protein
MMTFEILTIIVLLNVAATIELWRRAARRPEKPKRRSQMIDLVCAWCDVDARVFL